MADGKIIRVPFEAARDVPGDSKNHTLSARSQLLILSQTAYLHWNTRWYRQDGAGFSDADKEDIEDWTSMAEAEVLNAIDDTIDAPFWDTDEDVDDELPVEEQPWYGTVSDPEVPQEELDFVENAAIFALTGFLAAATWEAGFAPAILFHTLAPRFVIAMKRGDVGEVIRILVDGEEAAIVDTTPYAEGDVIEQPILTADSEAGHDLAIVQVS